MIVSPSRLQAFRTALEGAAFSTTASLRESGTFPWDLSVSRAALCGLSDFPERAIFCGEEMMASVLVSHRGKLPGTSVISLEPGHALTLIRSLGVEGDPLDIYRSAGAGVLRGILGWFGGTGGTPAELGDPILEERSLVATILGTHAPSNTMVGSLEIEFASTDQTFPACLYLLVDAKLLGSALDALENGVGGAGSSVD